MDSSNNLFSIEWKHADFSIELLISSETINFFNQIILFNLIYDFFLN